jgi:hypothetical protein
MLPKDRNDREYRKFVEDDGGNVAVRVVGSSGSTSLDVTNTSADLSGYVGKASGTNADFVTAYAGATTITLSTLPTGVTSIKAADIMAVEQYSTTGALTKRWTRDDAAMSATGTDPTTLTITGATFVNTDTFVVYTSIRRPTATQTTLEATNTLLTGIDADTDAIKTATQLIDDAISTDDTVQLATPKIMNVGGEYRSSATTYTDGDATILQSDINGNLKIAGYDSSTEALKQYDINPVNQQYTTRVETVTEQNLTNAYANYGSEIDMRGYTKLKIFIIADVNNSENVLLKVLGKHTSAGTDTYDEDGIFIKTLWTTGASDFKKSYTFETNGIPFLQLQAIAGTVGATAGDLTISIVKVW